MGDLITFTPRPRPVQVSAEPTDAEIRARIEAVAEAAVDLAQHLIATLDRMDGDTDIEDGADAEPSLAAPEHDAGSQVGWCRGGDGDREAEAPEIALPEAAIEPWPLPWSGRANVVTVAAGAVFDLIERRG